MALSRVSSLALTLVLAGLIVAVAASLIGDGAFADMAATAGRILFGALCLIGLPICTLRERLLLVGALALAASALFIWPPAQPVVADALDLGAFFGAFIVALTMVKEAAVRSRSVLKVGRYLITRPPGRRYFTVAIGGHVLGAFLNFGAVSLLAPMIQNGARDAQGNIDPDLERRQIAALIRGFSWILLWAPTTLTQAVLLTLFTEVDYRLLVTAGILTSVFFIVLGRVVDRFEWRNSPAANAPNAAPPTEMPGQALTMVSLICGTLISGTFVLMGLSGYSVAQALLFTAPLVTIVWLVLQGGWPVGPAVLARRLAAIGPIMLAGTPALARSGIALGLSGFIGRTAAKVLPMDVIAAQMDLAAMPCWLFLALLPVVITLSGQIALSPILVVVFLGEVLNSMPMLPATPTQIVFALSAGWSLSMTASPNATATLLISSTCGIPPTTLTWRWNGRYALICYAALVAIFVATC